jgi:hypothetical protein
LKIRYFRPGRSPVRWNPDLDEFELRCEHCTYNRGLSYWPITEEFWDRKRMSRCRACWKTYEHNRLDVRRRERKTAREAAEAAERRRAYNRNWMRLYRARQGVTTVMTERKEASDNGVVRQPSPEASVSLQRERAA